MRVHFERSGGFAGRKLSTSIDEPVPTELRNALEGARFFDLPSRGTGPARGADRMQYSITVTDGGKSHTVTVSDGAVPEPLQPVIDYLSKAAAGQAGNRR